MKILITGANGFLGQHLTVFLAGKKHAVFACSRGTCRVPIEHRYDYHDIELANPATVQVLLQQTKPDIIIHTAANSKPDDCEIDREGCIQQNVTVTKDLLQAAKKAGAKKFIYLSTDFIFGENGPHAEGDETGPLNFYGESKLLAEKYVQESGMPYAIIRPVFIYGPAWTGLRPTFLHWVKSNLEQKKTIKVVSDQIRTPTYVMDICKGLESIMLLEQEGIFHLAGKDLLSPYDMAIEVASFLGLDAALIKNVTSESFREPVQRAKRSGLKIDKAKQLLNYNPVDFRYGVELTFNHR